MKLSAIAWWYLNKRVKGQTLTRSSLLCLVTVRGVKEINPADIINIFSNNRFIFYLQVLSWYKLNTLALKQLYNILRNKQHYPSTNQRYNSRGMFGEHEKSL